MEQRKLIHFGKSAFCITLPQAWLKKNKIKKGDLLSVRETLRNSLEIIPADIMSESGGHQELSIGISGKSTDEIVQLLLSAYLNGYSVITLHGPNAGKVALVRKRVHEFISAEIMEVTSSKIIINVLWDINNINLHSIIDRIGHITKSIFSETMDLIDSGANIKDISEKGFEVQRQVLLARRVIKYALNNSVAAHKFNLSSLELLYLSYITYFFGMIGECIVKIAQIIDETKPNKFKDLLKSQSAKKELKALIQRTLDYYGKVFDTYIKHNHLVKFVFSEYDDFETSIDNFRKKNLRLWAPLLAEYIKITLSKIKETELIMISMDNSSK